MGQTTPISTVNVTPVRPLPPTTPTLTTIPPSTGDTGTDWQLLQPGLEQNSYIPNNNRLSQLNVIRIDPTRFDFRVHYSPGSPMGVVEWQRVLPDAVVIINANFFTPEHTITGLLIADGQVYGSPYRNGGTFAVRDGIPRVFPTAAEPYTGQPYTHLAQAFPLLVMDGVAAFNDTTQTQVSRRTVIAQDMDGRILLMVTPLVGLSLSDLSVYLPTTDMNILHAFNLDGGGSTLMVMNVSNTARSVLPSFDPVPAVIAVYPR